MRDMKYNYEDFDENLYDDMKNCEKIYNEYLKNPNDKDEYWRLKEAVYYVSLAIKEAKVSHRFSNDLLDEMKEYYWWYYD